MSGFPEVIFGRCPICGSNGADATGGNADVAATNTTGNGIELEYYDGKVMCEICAKRLKADAESLLAAQKHAEDERFRAAAGFVKTVS
jgi:ribosomal protein S27E